MTRLVNAKLVDAGWNADQYKGMITDSVVGHRDPQGQPEEHQDLGRPDQAGRRGDHAQPVHLRRRAWNIMAGYGAKSEQGRRRGRRGGVPAGAVRQRPGAGRQRPHVAADLHRRQGRRLHLLRERGDLRPAERPGDRLHRARRDHPDREPDRGHHATARTRRRPRRSSTSCTRRTAQKIFAENGYRPVVAGVGGPTLPDPAAAVHHRRPRRLAEGQQGFFDPTASVMASIEQKLGHRHRRAEPSRRATRDTSRVATHRIGRRAGSGTAAGPARRPWRPPDGRPGSAHHRQRLGTGLGLGTAVLYLSLIVLIPLAAVVWRSTERRAGRLLGRHHHARTRGPRSSSPSSPRAIVAVVNVVMGTADRLGAGARPLPGQGAWSTRSSTCRSRCRRSWPAWCCWRCTAPSSPLHLNLAYTRLGVVRRAAVRDAAVRRAHRAAGAARARPRHGAGGGLARAPARG